MISTSSLAAIRFGYGFAPGMQPPGGAGDLLAGLTGPDRAVAAWPVPSLAASLPLSQSYLDARKVRRAADAAAGGKDKAAGRAMNLLRREVFRQINADALAAVARAVTSPDGFRERLVRFWADHFTVRAKNLFEAGGVAAFPDEAIRPHLTARFGDMLVAAATHPAMLVYLDQTTSFGPNSPFALRHNRGLNENLAREVLELHTLGVGGAYGQDDVTAFAKLLTGLSFTMETGFVFRPNAAEPGAEVVLGKSYGGRRPARLEDIHAALHDIAVHPDTAKHLARKLAVHFVSDSPDAGLVDHVAAAYGASGGDLMATYTALLDHPAAWDPVLAKARQPFDFMVAALRALQVDMAGLLAMTPKAARGAVFGPLQLMGQPYGEPGGPNGWPEEALAWINPAGLAARIQWAMTEPEQLAPMLPDPRAFVGTALGDVASAVLVRAVAGAESVPQGVGLVLASAEFNRR